MDGWEAYHSAGSSLLRDNSMLDVLDVLLHRCRQLALDEEVAHQVNKALAPLCEVLENPEDLGYYFHNAERCATFCCRNPDNRFECTLLLWSVCEGLREQIEGLVGFEVHKI